MNFLDLEDRVKAPFTPQWVAQNAQEITAAVEDYLLWGDDPEEQQKTLTNLGWSVKWKNEKSAPAFLALLMPFLSAENRELEMVCVIEKVSETSVHDEPDAEYFKQAREFCQQWVEHIPLENQLVVFKNLLGYPFAAPADSAMEGVLETLCKTINWKQYEEWTENQVVSGWDLPSQMVQHTEHHYANGRFLTKIAQLHPQIVFDALLFVVALQQQGGYIPEASRLEMFNNRLLEHLPQEWFADLFDVYTSTNHSRENRCAVPLDIPTALARWNLLQHLQDTPSTTQASKKI